MPHRDTPGAGQLVRFTTHRSSQYVEEPVLADDEHDGSREQAIVVGMVVFLCAYAACLLYGCMVF